MAASPGPSTLDLNSLTTLLDGILDSPDDAPRAPLTASLESRPSSSYRPPTSVEDIRPTSKSVIRPSSSSNASRMDMVTEAGALDNDELERLLDNLLDGENDISGIDTKKKIVSTSFPTNAVQDENGINVGASSADILATATTTTKQRCVRLLLGASSARGHKASNFQRCVCSNIICLKCNFTVLTFAGSQWRPEMDYLFLRTNLNPNDPNNSKLTAKLDTTQAGSTAYCCQCSFTSVGENEREISAFDGELSWSCGGHVVPGPG